MGVEPAITGLLDRWKSGDRSVENELVRWIYPTLRELARSQMRRQGQALTLQATELANEAYARLVQQQGVDWKNRDHFAAISATVLRRVLVDYLRERSAEKRGAGAERITLDGARAGEIPGAGDHFDWLALDQALNDLARADPDAARVVELRLFSGLEVEQIAAVCHSSTATVGRQWRFARNWLAQQLQLDTPQ
ncbi:MAG: sigma-70 family RNA polymerase sigma factor [Xanthomonadales bacterium]|nr:sigma-70 family RNA polymerase sigma factor [Xanthomonadales bacterium]